MIKLHAPFYFKAWILSTGILLLFTSCTTIKPYEKEYLLHPLMDDQASSRLEGSYTTRTRPRERLAAVGVSSGSTSCPTCGGK